ncbi:MAG: hypothetical protein K9G67_03420 [Bacteroidales bacterium]|nr:hypothetical protein [Bacteroidales bacterium]MCF8350831.1 hypothetical protein [Bacteroidales bacterium]MCF8375380.1 hypothetical protein [Bacteroidales bacterium]MCF8401281.1 hypothetical protein [Bacteroidales bacterium]
MEKYFSNKSIVGLLFKWKYHIIIITVIAAILAVIFSGPAFIKPLFKSFAVVYPSNMAPYSDESETEQMLQMMQSRDIKDSLIKKFNLAKHYEIDSSYKYFYSSLLWEYDQRVSINKTPYESVEIEVLDKDPDTAYMIVNEIIHFFNKKVRSLHNDKWLEVIRIYEDQISLKKQGIDSLKNVMIEIGDQYGLFEYEGQSEEITEGLLGTIDGNAGKINRKEVNRLYEGMKKKSGELISLYYQIKSEAEALSTVNLEYEQARRFYTDKLTYTNVVSPPYPADKKSYPVRWLIVVITVIATAFLSSLVVVILENYKTYTGYISGRKEKSKPTKNNPS